MLKVFKEWFRCNFCQHLIILILLLPPYYFIIITNYYTHLINLSIFRITIKCCQHEIQGQLNTNVNTIFFNTETIPYHLDMQLYHLTLKMMNPTEAKLLRPQLKRLYQVLEPGFADLTWNALGIADFVKVCTAAINNFRNVINQVGVFFGPKKGIFNFFRKCLNWQCKILWWLLQNFYIHSYFG